MNGKSARAWTFSLLVGGLSAAGCNACGPWGAPPPSYGGGFGPAAAAGPPSTAAPPANYGQNLSVDPGWKPAGSAAPAIP